jgi:hypothetical protein
MNEERIPNERLFLCFLQFLAGSEFTLLLLACGEGPLSGWGFTSGAIVAATLTFLLLIIGFGTGIWMLIGRPWCRYPRSRRLNLAFAYLVVGWVGGLLIFLDTPALAPWAAASLPILAAYLLFRFPYILRRLTRDEDPFP